MDYVGDSPAVVIFSHDSALLKTRQWLLESAGCVVSPVMQLSNFELILRTHPIAIVILCQTLKPEECYDADQFATEHCPDARMLLLLGAKQKYIPDRECLLLDANCGPLVFVSTVESLLRSSGGSIAVVH